jgi:hypothetical protein
LDGEPLGPAALDFWLGRWSLSWASGGHGTNTIRRILGDRAIEESFVGTDPSGTLEGRSLSVLDVRDGRWRQTWVDSTGAYLDFVGVDADGVISFERSAADGARQRMRWLDVSTERLNWHWERSLDGGTTWELLWAIAYERLNESS